MFKNNESDLLVRASEISYAQIHHEKDLSFKKTPLGLTFPIKSKSGSEFMIHELSYRNKPTDLKLKTEYVADDGKNLQINLKREEADAEIKYKISKFSSQAFYNDPISPKYFSEFPNKEIYKAPFYQGLKAKNLSKLINTAYIRETLGASIASTICSFLDKYYNSGSELNYIYDWNAKQLTLNAQNHSLTGFDHPVKPRQTNAEVTEYNAFVTTYNQLLNELVWQKVESKDIRERFPKLKIIKGVPSFPLIEKAKSRDYAEILTKMRALYNDARQATHRVKKSSINSEELAEWLSRKSRRSGKDVTQWFESLKKHYAQDQYNNFIVPPNRAYAIWKELLKMLEDKIFASSKLQLTSPKDVRKFADLHAQYVSAASKLIMDKSTEKYKNDLLNFNTLTSLLKASPFEDLKEEKKEISFSGFSSDGKSLKKGFALCFKEEAGKIKFYVIFNLHQPLNLKYDKNGIYHAISYVGSGESIKAVIEPINFAVTKGTCILPIAFGKRIGRKYFYDNSVRSMQNQLDFIKDLQVKFSNLRVIRESVNTSKGKDWKYYCAISLERRFDNKALQKEYMYENILGMDMGEKIPAVIALINKDTNKIILTKNLREEMDQKLHQIQNKKDESQRLEGSIPFKLSHSIKNFTQKLLEDIAIESLELAIKNKALLVTEDLARGFGRGASKGTYVWMRQYTKLNDILAMKSSELGLIKSQPKAVYTAYGILAKVPAAYTSKTSIQTGFILRSPYYMSMKEDIANSSQIEITDDLGTTFVLDLSNKTVLINWRGQEATVEYKSIAQLGVYYNSEYGRSKAQKIEYEVFNNRSSNSKGRQKAILTLIYNVLNPRRTQAEHNDIFMGRKVNADAQGAINIARSFLYAQSSYYKEFKKLVEKNKNNKNFRKASEGLRSWQDWYVENLTEVPASLFIT